MPSSAPAAARHDPGAGQEKAAATTVERIPQAVATVAAGITAHDGLWTRQMEGSPVTAV